MILRDYFVIAVMIAIMTIAYGLVLTSMSTDYEVTVDSSFNDTYNNLGEISSLSSNITNAVGGSTEVGTLGILDVVVNGGWKALKITLSLPSLYAGMISDFGDAFNIPSVFVWGFTIIVTIGILFGIISTIFRIKT